MPNFIVKHNRRSAIILSESKLWEILISSCVLMLFGVVASVFSIITYLLDSICPRFLRWRRTSYKELEDTDRKILDSLPCIKERKFVTVGNENLWSVSCNPDKNGTPIVLVHGMGGGVGLWSMNLEDLSKTRPVYAFDLLGFGRSSRPSFSDNALEAENKFVESIEGYRKAMGLDKFILLGHSLGGFLSAAYCLQYPQHVKHLILVDPWGMAKMPPDGRMKRDIPFFFRIVLTIVNSFNPMSTLRAIGPFGPHLVKRYRPGLAQMFASKLGDETLLHSYIYHCNAQNPSGETGFKSMTWNIGWAKEPMIDRISQMDPELPITFIYGAESWIDRNTGWMVKYDRQGYVDVQVLRGAGHHVYADRWELFNSLVEAIASFVDKNKLPVFDSELVQRIHGVPSIANFNPASPTEPDFQQPVGFVEETDVQMSADSKERSEPNIAGEHQDNKRAENSGMAL